jgi:RNA polymerase sigma factor (sigma-70 family)
MPRPERIPDDDCYDRDRVDLFSQGDLFRVPVLAGLVGNSCGASGPEESEVGDLSDRVLWEMARAGDGGAFGVLFERHGRRIYNYCFRRTADWALAEDLTSATFFLAWRAHGSTTLEAESALPWLYGIATNVLRNQRRSSRRRRDALARLTMERLQEPDFAEEALTRIDDEREMSRLLELLSKLPRREQDVIALCDWSGLSYDDAAQALRVPIGTVRSRLARGRRRLRELASATGPEAYVQAVPLRIEVKEQ